MPQQPNSFLKAVDEAIADIKKGNNFHITIRMKAKKYGLQPHQITDEIRARKRRADARKRQEVKRANKLPEYLLN
jgi:hypothetical protein